MATASRSVSLADRSALELGHFNADAMLAAQEAPKLTVGRFLYVGQLLSIDEWLPWWERYQALEQHAASVTDDSISARGRILKARSEFFRDYLYAVFPRRRYTRPFFAPDPVAHLMKQPFQVVQSTVAFFFILQARATFGAKTEDSAPSATGGTPSPTPTAASADAPLSGAP